MMKRSAIRSRAINSVSRPTEVVEVDETVLETVWVIVVDGVGIERQEHAEDRIGAARRDSTEVSAGGSTRRGGARGSLSRSATMALGVGAVSSEVIDVTVVVVVLEISVAVEVGAVSTSVPVVMVIVVLLDLQKAYQRLVMLVPGGRQTYAIVVTVA
jgi:hypothetical protein